MAVISKCQSGWPRECGGITPPGHPPPIVSDLQWSAQYPPIVMLNLQRLIGKIGVFPGRVRLWHKLIGRKYISEGSLMVIFSLLTKAINSSTSLFARLKWLCWGRYQHMQDNDNKPTIKAFKIQLEPGLELTPSNTFPAVLTHLGWGWPLEPGKGFFSFQQPSVYCLRSRPVDPNVVCPSVRM